MNRNEYGIGDIVTTAKQLCNIFGDVIPKGEPVKIMNVNKDGYTVRDWKGLTIS